MFRRRPPRRLPGLCSRPLRRFSLPPGVRWELARVNRLMDDVRFAEAARACFAADQVEPAVEWARADLRLFGRGSRAGWVPHLPAS